MTADPPTLPVWRQELRRISDGRTLLAIVGDWFTIFAAATCAHWSGSLLVYMIAVAIIAGRMVAFFFLGHEASHNHLLRSRSPGNRVSDWMLFYPLLSTTTEFRRVHSLHHRHLGKPGDPALSHLAALNGPMSRGRRLWLLLIRPLLGYDGFMYLRDVFRFPRQCLPCLMLWLPIAALAWVCDGWGLFALYWLVPLLWLFPIFLNWSRICDHYRVLLGTRDSHGLFARLFTHPHNAGYHWIHHLRPEIPWHKLAEADRMIAPPDREATFSIVEIIRIVWPPDSHFYARTEQHQ